MYMDKHGYSNFHYDFNLTMFFRTNGTPGSIIAYKDDLVLVAERDLVSYVDIKGLRSDEGKKKIEKRKLIGNLTNGYSIENMILISES